MLARTVSNAAGGGRLVLLLGVAALALWGCGHPHSEPTVADLIAAAPAVAPSADRQLAQQEVELLGPFAQWSLPAPEVTGNAFDVRAYVRFTHTSTGQTRTTGMFFAPHGAEKRFAFRFTGDLVGEWTLRSFSEVAALNGWSGSVVVTQAGSHGGFVGNKDGYWWRSGSVKHFAPQYVMYGGPPYIAANAHQLADELLVYLQEQGFSGVHVPVLCHWFSLEQSVCGDHVNPDVATFQALEELITTTYRLGGVVHLWAWGDSQRSQNPKALTSQAGLNGEADSRLQRYLAARLGPLPGWTMGYGFDLWEWADAKDLERWRDKLRDEMGWPHLLGARAGKNEISQISSAMDYVSFEQHQPGSAGFKAARSYQSDKPVFSEDRFRFRGSDQRAKDYLPQDMVVEMWRAALQGGIAAIWGNLVPAGSTDMSAAIAKAQVPSAPFADPTGFRNFQRFFRDRFRPPLSSCPTNPSIEICTEFVPTRTRVLLQNGVQNLALELDEPMTVTVVKLLEPYAELMLGSFAVGQHQVPFDDKAPRAIWLQPTSAQN